MIIKKEDNNNQKREVAFLFMREGTPADETCIYNHPGKSMHSFPPSNIDKDFLVKREDCGSQIARYSERKRILRGGLPVILVSNVRPKRVSSRRRINGYANAPPAGTSPAIKRTCKTEVVDPEYASRMYTGGWLHSLLSFSRGKREAISYFGRSAQIPAVATGIITRSERRRRAAMNWRSICARACVESEAECNRRAI